MKETVKWALPGVVGGLFLGRFLSFTTSFYLTFYDKPERDLFAGSILLVLGVLTARYYGKSITSLAWYLILPISYMVVFSDNLGFLLLSATDYHYWVFYLSLFGITLFVCLLPSSIDRYFFLTFIPSLALFFFVDLSEMATILLLAFSGIAMTTEVEDGSRYFAFLIPLLLFLSPGAVHIAERQHLYSDKVIFSAETPYHQLDITEWKNNHWFYYNGKNQFSSLDHNLYYEPFAISPVLLHTTPRQVLVLGGENGLLLNELEHLRPTLSITHIPIDLVLMDTLKHSTVLNQMNDSVFFQTSHTPDQVQGIDYLDSTRKTFDIIYIDLPDPEDPFINQYFTQEFYQTAYAALDTSGILITQSLSPYLSPQSFSLIERTISASGFNTLPIHNQVISTGEWSWIIGSKIPLEKPFDTSFNFESLDWMTLESLKLIFNFGKSSVSDTTINRLGHPLLIEMYQRESSKN